MTAKEYVEGKVKSYTRLAERCKKRRACPCANTDKPKG